MLEFLWVMNEAGARSSVIAPTHLWERRYYPPTGYFPIRSRLSSDHCRACALSSLPVRYVGGCFDLVPGKCS
jgi:hypothetical protein